MILSLNCYVLRGVDQVVIQLFGCDYAPGFDA
jgi:hypothetical protein